MVLVEITPEDMMAFGVLAELAETRLDETKELMLADGVLPDWMANLLAKMEAVAEDLAERTEE